MGVPTVDVTALGGGAQAAGAAQRAHRPGAAGQASCGAGISGDGAYVRPGYGAPRGSRPRTAVGLASCASHAEDRGTGAQWID